MPSDPRSPFWHLSLQDEVGTDSRTNAQPVRGWAARDAVPGQRSCSVQEACISSRIYFFLMLLLKISRNIFYMKRYALHIIK